MRRTARARLFRFAPFLVLAAENLVVFYRHYFSGYGFPWDFVGSYYAAAAYWTQALAHGGLPMWMPFQSMGYPFLVNLQTGLWYPPMWVFPIFRIPYTLGAAVVLQCLHVLAGALGMYVLVHAVLRSRREALLAAFAFQLFGGFYSNAEHVDIVRSFAMLPWLLWAATPPSSGQTRLPRRILFVPLFVFLLAVGGYPGNLIASIFLLAVFAALVLAHHRFARGVVRWAVALGGSVLLGLAMAAIHLGPAWIYRAELVRYHVSERIYRATMTAAHLPGLFLEPLGMPGDISMTSTFVGFAVLAGACLLARASLRRLWPYAVLCLLAAAMAAGNTLPVHGLLRSLAPPLGYSRFPPSDYRGFAAILLILLAGAGWRDLRRRRYPPRALAWRLLPVALFAAWGILRVYAAEPFWPQPALAGVALLAALAALAIWRRARPAAATLAMFAAISLDAARVLPRVQGWVVPDLIAVCRVFSPTPARMHDAGVVVAPGLFEKTPASRPPRTEGDAGYKASGYLAGDYVLGDFGGPVLRARATIMKDERWLAFMRREWLPVLVDEPSPSPGDDVEVADLRERAASAAPDPRVAQIGYGIDRVRYRVSSERPLLLVENEIYFPGWTANVDGVPVAAVRVNDLFRGWRLPAGTYDLETRFRLSGLRLLAAASGAAWLALLLLAAAWRRHHRALPGFELR